LFCGRTPEGEVTLRSDPLKDGRQIIYDEV
jgi:hypothetical protein